MLHHCRRERPRLHALSVAGHLEETSHRHRQRPEKKRNADEPFIPDRAHLDGGTIAHDRHHRGDAGAEKIHGRNGLVRFVQHLFRNERHRLQLRNQSRVLLGRDSAQQQIRFRGLAALRSAAGGRAGSRSPLCMIWHRYSSFRVRVIHPSRGRGAAPGAPGQCRKLNARRQAGWPAEIRRGLSRSIAIIPGRA